MNTNEHQVNHRTMLRNASIVVFGGVCAILMANRIIQWISDWNEPSIFPGFRIMSYLCFPVLYFWAGMLLRFWKDNPKRWVKLIVLGLSLYCLFRYVHRAENWWFIGHLYFSVIGLGYLTPLKNVVPASQSTGWISLLMLLLSMFCYTTIATVKERFLWRDVLIPEHPDMELMLETILIYAEPLMTIVILFLLTQFAFSQIAQSLGAQDWFKGMIAVPCIFAFLCACQNLFTQRFIYTIHDLRYSPMLCFIVQPVTVWLIVSAVRRIKKIRERKA